PPGGGGASSMPHLPWVQIDIGTNPVIVSGCSGPQILPSIDGSQGCPTSPPYSSGQPSARTCAARAASVGEEALPAPGGAGLRFEEAQAPAVTRMSASDSLFDPDRRDCGSRTMLGASSTRVHPARQGSVNKDGDGAMPWHLRCRILARGGKACLLGHDDDAEDRRRDHRGSPAWLASSEILDETPRSLRRRIVLQPAERPRATRQTEGS